jgi:hypothetical protein
MLETLIVGLTVIFWVAGIASLILAKMILERFAAKVERTNLLLSGGGRAEADAPPKRSTLLPGFAILPIQRLRFSKLGAARKFEALTHHS